MTRLEYDKLLASGMFFEFHPELTGDWFRDKFSFFREKWYVSYLQEPVGEDWTVIRSFEEFKQELIKLKKIPDHISFDYSLDEKSLRWCLDPKNEGTAPPYHDGMETTIKCLVFLNQVCLKNSLTYKDISLVCEHPQALFDLRNFIVLSAKEQGVVPQFDQHQVEIRDDFHKSSNYRKFLKIKESVDRPFKIEGKLTEGRIIASDGYHCSHKIATPTEPTVYQYWGTGTPIDLLDYPKLIPHMLVPLRKKVLEAQRKNKVYFELVAQGISPENAKEAANQSLKNPMDYLKERGMTW